MASLLRRLVSRDRTSGSTTRSKDEETEEFIFEEDRSPEKPFIMCSLYYLSVILLIGLPMWFYTCSSTRYSLPDLTLLESKLSSASQLRLHLDISVVQLAAMKPTSHDTSREKQSDYLRANLPSYLNISSAGDAGGPLAYNIDWRIRRPTQEESQLMKSIARENDNPANSQQQREAIFARLEESLLKLHKPSNRFRLFMYLFEEPLNSLVCDRPQTYLVNFERFIYLCPADGEQALVDLIQAALHETYSSAVDLKRAKKILSGRTDLLLSLIPENGEQPGTRDELSRVADKVHSIYERNVKSRFLELAEVLNIRVITQNLMDLLGSQTPLDKILKKEKKEAKTVAAAAAAKEAGLNINATEQQQQQQERFRVPETRELGQFFHHYESRLNKHSAQSVHHVMTLVPDPAKPRLVFEPNTSGATDGGTAPSQVNIMEERDANFILIGDSDKSLVLGLRAIVRRLIGLSSVNLCVNCRVRRDVFFNKWELDAVVGALTALKLQSVLVSLRAISQQAIGIKIPKHVSSMAHEAHESALKSIESLELKRPLEAYRQVSSGHELAEAAFYDPSLLETLYFPDETKYAIYLPLFLPLAFPLAMSALRLVKYSIFNRGGGTSNSNNNKEKLQ